MTNFTQKFSKIIQEKQSRLCLSLDVTTTQEFLYLADLLGPYVCMVKTHIDILSDFSWETVVQLKRLAKKHNFLIFEDRKFADIGKTVKHQCANGIYKISEWADLINAHVLPGEGIVTGLQEACKNSDTKLLLIAEMSSSGNLFSPVYTEACIDIAKKYSYFVVGFIAQKNLINFKNKNKNGGECFWHFTPGVHLDISAGRLGQQYRTPEQALVRDACDVIIVGAGIYESKDPVAAAMEYQRQSYMP